MTEDARLCTCLPHNPAPLPCARCYAYSECQQKTVHDFWFQLPLGLRQRFWKETKFNTEPIPSALWDAIREETCH